MIVKLLSGREWKIPHLLHLVLVQATAASFINQRQAAPAAAVCGRQAGASGARAVGSVWGGQTDSKDQSGHVRH